MAMYRPTTCCGLAEIAEVGESTEQAILSAITRARQNLAGRCFATTTDNQGEAVKSQDGATRLQTN